MDTATLLLELGAVLLVLTVAARVALRVGLSPIPLYVLTGLALGEGGPYPFVTAERFIVPAAEIGVVVVLSVLVAEDLVMAVYLPILGALLAGGTALAVSRSLVVALAVAGLALLAAFRLGEHLTRALASPSGEALLLGVMGLTLLVAGLAERLPISAAAGAFLVGIALSGPAQQRIRGLLQPLRDLFAAAFFLLFGLALDPGDIPPVLALAVRLDRQIGAVATAYVLLLATVGPLATRLVSR